MIFSIIGWILRIISDLLNIYSFLIVIYTLLTWIPRLLVTKVGRVLGKIVCPRGQIPLSDPPPVWAVGRADV